jgi:hypothetical protein
LREKFELPSQTPFRLTTTGIRLFPATNTQDNGSKQDVFQNPTGFLSKGYYAENAARLLSALSRYFPEKSSIFIHKGLLAVRISCPDPGLKVTSSGFGPSPLTVLVKVVHYSSGRGRKHCFQAKS